VLDSNTSGLFVAYHPLLQCVSVVPQKPLAPQHWPLKSPPAHVRLPLLEPQGPSRVQRFDVRQVFEKGF
jgi:hypothetical protein